MSPLQFASFAGVCLSIMTTTSFGSDGPLERYVQAPDTSYNWKATEQKTLDGGTAHHLEFVSQTWRGQFWSHHLQILRPTKVRNPEIAFLYITGDGSGESDLKLLGAVAQRAGAICGVLTKVPNQPLYNGRKEDSLIAYTLDQYLRTGDETWPLLFPMVKSAVRAMDTIQAYAQKEFQQEIKSFVVSGASKRGWTTWLTAATDTRVKGIAPMVIDMLNMRAQLNWAEKVYGQQSEQIHDYTELKLHQKVDDPPMQRLRSWIDPYAYLEHYSIPKLLLLGTNDPYWTVDSLRHYWNDLPEPKVLFQTPNAGHDLAGGSQAIQTLAAWFQMIADHQPFPQLSWEIQGSKGKAEITVKANQAASHVRLWTADSPDRDLRNDKWTSKELELGDDKKSASVKLTAPEQGYRAFLLEVEFISASGDRYKLSTEARVIPDDIR